MRRLFDSRRRTNAADFLSREPDYDEPAWVDAYATMLGRRRPDIDSLERLKADAEGAAKGYRKSGRYGRLAPGGRR